MITLTINLLAEEQQAERARARDPFKIVLAIGISCITLTVITGVVLSLIASKKETEASNLEDRWNTLNASYEVAQENAFQEVKRYADDIVELNRSRPVYAPQLASIKDIIPQNIQLNRLSFSVSSASQNPVPNPVAGGDEAEPKRIVRPRVTQLLSLVIDGKIISDRPEIDVDEFIKTLRETPSFRGNPNAVQLRSLGRSSAASKGNGHQVSEAYFVIECKYKEQT